MYKWHEKVLTPSDEKTIWRYMTIAKYIDLLHRKKLFLCRVDQFDDPYEGEWTKGWREETQVPEELITSWFKKQYFVSCWHLAEYESVAMWKIYCSENDGVAIKTTIGKLKDSLGCDQDQQIHIGEVEYIDDHSNYVEKKRFTGYWGGLGQVCKKRKIFSYENEVRIIEDDFDNKSWFSYARFLDFQFIEEVRLAPLMSDMFMDSLKDVSEKYGLSAEFIRKSTIYDSPKL